MVVIGCWRLVVYGMCTDEPTIRYWAGVIGSDVVGPGDQTGRPYIRGVDIIELRFDKMSNEGVYNVLPRTKIRFGGFGGPSRAIRKIQIDADRGVGTTFRRVLGTDGCPFFCFSFLISLFLLPSDLLTAPFF